MSTPKTEASYDKGAEDRAVTLKRVAHAVSKVGALATNDPHTIAKKLVAGYKFNIGVRKKNGWELGDGPAAAAGADCRKRAE